MEKQDKIITENNENKEIKENNVEKQEKAKIILPLIPLRGKVFFPRTILNFDVGRQVSIRAIENASGVGGIVFISAQKNIMIENPKKGDLSKTGVVAKIKQIMRSPNGSMKVSVEGLYRAKITEFLETRDFFTVSVAESPYKTDTTEEETEAYFRVAKSAFYEFTLLDKRITKEMIATVTTIEEPNAFIDNALSLVAFKEKDVQEILDEDVTSKRLSLFEKLFLRELEIARIEQKISTKVRESIDQSQKEYYLREQIKAIHSELGDDEDEKESLRKKILDKKLPKDVEEKALKEVNRLDKINPSLPDYSNIINYLEWITEMPFNECTVDTKDLKKAKEILDKDHFGLEKVKERIVEYIAVLQLTKKIKGPIICFVGPPGVGKTSVATSIARALNRKFVRMSLGGVKDEAEIRGHRRTYVGAMPGRIMYGLKNAGVNNPVFLLDEIDKLSSDIHGDPASALLEVLDPEQNVTFRDRFMEIPYDLSKVMFITTANSIDTIPYPLLDRMEIIEISGYTDEEKLQIAKRYLVPKQLEQNGLSEKKVTFSDDAIKEIIEGYTFESGVRNLERQIASVVRKIATKFAENQNTSIQKVNKNSVEKYLGVKKRLKDNVPSSPEVGMATGLAWTQVGGTTLIIEVSLMSGKGEILLTGKLGDVMKESARAAISYIRAHAKKYGIKEDIFEKTDIHIHVPEGATPKDGPSAGITMATAILSAFTGKKVKNTVAMTGEITLRGKVLPIGGLKEKSLAAFRQGIYNVIIPKENEKDLTDITEPIRKKMNFIPVSNVDEVFNEAVIFNEN